MRQPFGFAARALDAGAMLLQRLARGTLPGPEPGDLGRLRLQAAMGVQQPPVRGRIGKRALVMLAVDLDQRDADRLEHLHAHRLVVDRGACAAVSQLHAPQDQLVPARDVVGGENAADRMPAIGFEHRRHLAKLCAVTHQAGVAARAERERERVEQDRLAGPGLAGQRRQTATEVDVETIDQDDVADREPDEHDDR